MSPTLRLIAGNLAGILVAMLVIAGIQAVGHQLVPPPAGLAEASADRQAALLAALPLEAWLPVLLSYFLGAEIGATLAGIVGGRPILGAAVVGAVLLGATAANLMLLPHPAWFAVTAVLVVLAGTAGGGFNAWLYSRRRTASAGKRPG